MYSSLDIYNKSITQAVTTVASPNAAHQRMAQFWDLISDLKEGTYKIRSEHRKYLPQLEREVDDSYDRRLARSTSNSCSLTKSDTSSSLIGFLTNIPDSIFSILWRYGTTVDLLSLTS